MEASHNNTHLGYHGNAVSTRPENRNLPFGATDKSVTGQASAAWKPWDFTRPAANTGKATHKSVYCARGQTENHIMALKTHLAADRTSCTSATASQLRLFLHAGAYWLMWTLRAALADEIAVAARPGGLRLCTRVKARPVQYVASAGGGGTAGRFLVTRLFRRQDTAPQALTR
jgi:hypothetical protein